MDMNVTDRFRQGEEADRTSRSSSIAHRPETSEIEAVRARGCHDLSPVVRHQYVRIHGFFVRYEKKSPFASAMISQDALPQIYIAYNNITLQESTSSLPS